MISNALSLLFGIIIIAAVVPYVFVQFGGLQEAVEGRCVARYIPSTGVHEDMPRPYPDDGTTWSVDQDWQTGGPFDENSVPDGRCSATMSTTRTGTASANTGPWVQNPTGGSETNYILFDYTPTDLSSGGNNFSGVITALLDLMPVAVFVGVFGLVVTFAWKKFGGGRRSGVPGM